MIFEILKVFLPIWIILIASENKKTSSTDKYIFLLASLVFLSILTVYYLLLFKKSYNSNKKDNWLFGSMVMICIAYLYLVCAKISVNDHKYKLASICSMLICTIIILLIMFTDKIKESAVPDAFSFWTINI